MVAFCKPQAAAMDPLGGDASPAGARVARPVRMTSVIHQRLLANETPSGAAQSSSGRFPPAKLIEITLRGWLPASGGELAQGVHYGQTRCRTEHVHDVRCRLVCRSERANSAWQAASRSARQGGSRAIAGLPP